MRVSSITGTPDHRPEQRPEQIPARRLRHLAQAIAALRRGEAVQVAHTDQSGITMLAAEFLQPGQIANLNQTSAHLVFGGDDRYLAPFLGALPAGDWLKSLPGQQQDHAQDCLAQDCLALARHAEILPLIVIWPADDAVTVPVMRIDPDSWASRDEDEAACLVRVITTAVPLADAEDCRVVLFRAPGLAIEHLALLIGQPENQPAPLVRLHSQCVTGDLLGSLRCDCGPQLRGAVQQLGDNRGGIILYLAHEGRAIGLANKLRAYQLQDDGLDTVDANLALGFGADNRRYATAAAMLKQLGINDIRLMTNNPDKIAGLEQAGVRVAERVPHILGANPHNHDYLVTKREKAGHLF